MKRRIIIYAIPIIACVVALVVIAVPPGLTAATSPISPPPTPTFPERPPTARPMPLGGVNFAREERSPANTQPINSGLLPESGSNSWQGDLLFGIGLIVLLLIIIVYCGCIFKPQEPEMRSASAPEP